MARGKRKPLYIAALSLVMTASACAGGATSEPAAFTTPETVATPFPQGEETRTTEPSQTTAPSSTRTSTSPTATQVLEPQLFLVQQNLTIPPGLDRSAAARCPQGGLLTGGGYATQINVQVYLNRPSDGQWQAGAVNDTASDQEIDAYALCLLDLPGETTVASKDLIVAAGAYGQVTANCPQGGAVLSGGFVAKGLTILGSSLSENGWQVKVGNPDAQNHKVTAYGLCYSGPQASIETVSQSLPVPAQTAGSLTAECPPGSYLTGGGFELLPGMRLLANTKGEGPSWMAFVHNLANVVQPLTTQAVCLSFP